MNLNLRSFAPHRLGMAIAVLLFFAVAKQGSAQVNVTSTGGTNSASYTTVADAVAAINSGTHTGTITVNVTAGHSETVPVGGISLTATGTATDPITFQKSGAGANPMLIAYAGGTGTPSAGVPDGIFRLMGSDYVTIDAIDVSDPNAANPATMEYGYGMFRPNATNGCQYNTFKNCNISLNRLNNGGQIAPWLVGSVGIAAYNVDPTVAPFTLIIPTSADGATSYNTIKSNIFTNVNIGVGFNGYNPTTFTGTTLLDVFNVVGGAAAADGNTVTNYGGGTGATNPSNGIQMQAQYDVTVSRNTINNNDGGGSNHTSTLRGIFISGTSLGVSATVTYNTVTVKGGGTTSQVAAIESNCGSSGTGNTLNFSNNTITNCSYPTATTGVFYGIYSTGAPANLTMSGNTLTNNASNATSGTFACLWSSGAVTGNITYNNNIINGVNFTPVASTSAAFYGIRNTGAAATSSLSISGNDITGLGWSGTATSSTSCSFYYNSGASLNETITNNTVSNVTIAATGTAYLFYNSNTLPANGVLTFSNNSLVGGLNRTTTTGTTYCYFSASSSTSTVTETFSNNSFVGINAPICTSSQYGIYNFDGASSPYPTKHFFGNLVAGFNSVGTIYGIYCSYFGANSTIHDNSVYNLTGAGSVFGIYISSSVVYVDIYSNTFRNLTTNGSGAYGAYLLGTTNSVLNFHRNNIGNVTNNASNGTSTGIYLSSGTTMNVYNNLVSGLSTPTLSSSTVFLNGIHVAGGTTANISNNTVYLEGTSTGTDFSSNAIYAVTATTTVLKNNIFINKSTPNGAGFAAAYRRSSSTLTTYGTESNANNFYAGTPSASNVIFYDGASSDQNITDFKNRVSPRDGNSFAENTTFLSLDPFNTGYLHIDPASATQCESGALPIAAITVDYDGETRQGNAGYSGTGAAPDIGADEGNFVPIDLSAPVITYTALPNTCSTGDLLLTGVGIADATGTPLSGTLIPRIYYRKNNGTWFNAAGSFVSGTSTSSVWDFTMTASDMGGLIVGDTAKYYVIAQDINSPTNIGSLPGGAVATDVNNVTAPPANPSKVVVLPILGGVYTVGSGGDFFTLTQAVNTYNASCLSGPVTLNLIDSDYSAGETFPISVGTPIGASATNNLTIKPAAGVNAVVHANSTSSILNINGADYVTIDGSNSGGTDRNLTFRNDTSLTLTVVLRVISLGVGAGATNCTIKNCIVIGGNGGTTSTTVSNYGIFVGGTAISTTSAGEDNDNLLIQNNHVMRVRDGIYVHGTATGTLDGLQLLGNKIGSDDPAYYLGWMGLDVIFANAPIISENQVYNIRTSAGTSVNGIVLGQNCPNAQVTRNKIHGLYSTSTTGWGAYGIYVNTSTGNSNILIANNMIWDFQTVNYSLTSTFNAFGIRMAGSTDSKIYYNSVNFYGLISLENSTTAPGMSTCIYISSGTGYSIANNIFHNKMEFENANSKAYSAYISSTAVTFTTINNNDYFGLSQNNTTYNVGYGGSAARVTLTDWQTYTTQDTASQNLPPAFVSDSDLHLDPLGATSPVLGDGAQPVAAVSIDHFGTTRSATVPTIGGHELPDEAECAVSVSDATATPTCAGSNNGSIVVTASCAVCTGSLEYSKDDGATWQPSNTFSGLAPGNYTVVVRDGGNTSCFVAFSGNPVNVAELPLPTVNITSSDAPMCVNETRTVEGSPVAGTFSVSGQGSLSGTTLTATAAGSITLTFAYTDANGCSNSATQSITVTPENYSTFYADTDSDTYGNANSTANGCAAPSGFVTNDTDCDDTDPLDNPAGTETCNDDDEDCDGVADDGLPTNDYYLDVDDDNYGAGTPVNDCAAPTGANYATTGGDCNDGEAGINPGAQEVCGNGTDENCDGVDGIGSFVVDIVKQTTACLKFNATISSVVGAAPGSLQYSKDGGTTYQASPTFLNLVPATYTFAVKDAANCTKTMTEVISAPMTLNTTGDALACFGNTNGEVSVSVNDGFPDYTYEWKKGTATVGTTATVGNLGFGTYKVSVTDSKGCLKISGNVYVTQPAKHATTLAVTAETCYQSANGSIANTTTGGTAPFTFAWTSTNGYSSSVEDPTGLSVQGAATFTVVATDANGCTSTKSAVGKGPALPLTVTMTTKAVPCFGGSDGSATAKAAGGNAGTKNFAWSNGTNASATTTHTITGLQANTYTVSVSDVNNCSVTGVATVAQPTAPLAVFVSSVTQTGSTYKVIMGASGGFTPYKFRRSLDYPTNSMWSAPNTGTFTLVSAGTHTFQVNDGGGSFSATAPKGCIVGANFDIPGTLKPSSTDVRGENLTEGIAFSLVPNPAQGSVFVDFGGQLPASGNVEIRDAKGSLVQNINVSKLTNSGNRIVLEGFASGVFFITLRQDGLTPATKRLVVMD